jgi:hypothetical protein
LEVAVVPPVVAAEVQGQGTLVRIAAAVTIDVVIGEQSRNFTHDAWIVCGLFLSYFRAWSYVKYLELMLAIHNIVVVVLLPEIGIHNETGLSTGSQVYLYCDPLQHAIMWKFCCDPFTKSVQSGSGYKFTQLSRKSVMKMLNLNSLVP